MLQLDPFATNPLLRALPSLQMLQSKLTLALPRKPPAALGVTQLD